VIKIKNHKDNCQCTGCRRKRGTYKSPRLAKGAEEYSESHKVHMTPTVKQWVIDQGGGKYIRDLIMADMIKKAGLPKI